MAAQTKVLQQLSFVFDEEQQSAISLGQATFFLISFCMAMDYVMSIVKFIFLLAFLLQPTQFLQ